MGCRYSDRQFPKIWSSLRPRAIIEDLDLLKPIYTDTSAYGHFGRENPDFTWENTGQL